MNRRLSVRSQLGDQTFITRDLSDIEMEYMFLDAVFELPRRRWVIWAQSDQLVAGLRRRPEEHRQVAVVTAPPLGVGLLIIVRSLGVHLLDGNKSFRLDTFGHN
jgi:hypothetical protein